MRAVQIVLNIMGFEVSWQSLRNEGIVEQDSWTIYILESLGTEMFAPGQKKLETRLIIKILTHPCYPRNFDLIFMGMKEFKINPKWPSQKTQVFLFRFLKKKKNASSPSISVKVSWVARMGQNCGFPAENNSCLNICNTVYLQSSTVCKNRSSKGWLFWF